MPEELDRCVRELMRQGYTESEAWAICKSRLNMKAKRDKWYSVDVINKKKVLCKKRNKIGC